MDGFRQRMTLKPPTLPPRVTVLYHYFYPDDVVSARHFSDLCEGLQQRGWEVVAKPCHRGCRDEAATYPRVETWKGIFIRRVWRPAFIQATGRGRLLNAVWMIAFWTLSCRRVSRTRREAMIVGTDPILSVMVARFWKFFKPSCRIAHWCFDLYPEAAVAEGMFRPESRFIRFLKRRLKKAYASCDLIVDLGPCMAELLAKYRSPAGTETLVPWALVEPAEPVEPDPPTRRELFGETSLGLLYSGSFGRAHSCEEFVDLARVLRGDSGIQFNFAARGNRFEELKASVPPEDSNIRFAGFAPESELEKRLGACDIHMVSLRPEWTGTVVPSKFFGALATGRVVLFSGSPKSAIARWIEEYRVGWVLTPDNLPAVADALRKLAADPTELRAMHARCHAVYQRHFRKSLILDRWDASLKQMVGSGSRRPTSGK